MIPRPSAKGRWLWCNRVSTEQGKGQWPIPTIQEPQTGLVDCTGLIFPGSHTGTLWFEYRYNDYHFLDEGFDEAARLWLNALTHQPAVATS